MLEIKVKLGRRVIPLNVEQTFHLRMTALWERMLVLTVQPYFPREEVALSGLVGWTLLFVQCYCWLASARNMN